MTEPLIFALPSKGRLKEQCEAWLADAGFEIRPFGGARGYQAQIKGLRGVSVQYLSASAIAAALDAGEVHLGVTGKDLVYERAEDIETRIRVLLALGFGAADVVVAVHESWVDVETMADVNEVAHDYLARTGRRLRVATKYNVLTRSFFAARGVVDYRIVASAGATEGAPAAGAAELIVDITTTGATLTANQLKVLSDGVILRSQASLAASLTATWSSAQRETGARLVSAVERSENAHAAVAGDVLLRALGD